MIHLVANGAWPSKVIRMVRLSLMASRLIANIELE